MIFAWLKNVLGIMSAAADRGRGRLPSRLVERAFRPSGGSWACLILEELEPRLAPTANLNFTAADHRLQSHASSRVGQRGGYSATRQQCQRRRPAKCGSHPGLRRADHRLAHCGRHADGQFLIHWCRHARAHHVLFAGKPNPLVTDKVVIGGAGTLYQPQSFTLQSDSNIVVLRRRSRRLATSA